MGGTERLNREILDTDWGNPLLSSLYSDRNMGGVHEVVLCVRFIMARSRLSDN